MHKMQGTRIYSAITTTTGTYFRCNIFKWAGVAILSHTLDTPAGWHLWYSVYRVNAEVQHE